MRRSSDAVWPACARVTQRAPTRRTGRRRRRPAVGRRERHRRRHVATGRCRGVAPRVVGDATTTCARSARRSERRRAGVDEQRRGGRVRVRLARARPRAKHRCQSATRATASRRYKRRAAPVYVIIIDGSQSPLVGATRRRAPVCARACRRRRCAPADSAARDARGGRALLRVVAAAALTSAARRRSSSATTRPTRTSFATRRERAAGSARRRDRLRRRVWHRSPAPVYRMAVTTPAFGGKVASRACARRAHSVRARQDTVERRAARRCVAPC